MFDLVFFLLAGNEDIHKSFDEFQFGLISFLTAELVALERLKKCLIVLTLEHKHFDRVFFIHAGKEDSHKKLG